MLLGMNRVSLNRQRCKKKNEQGERKIREQEDRFGEKFVKQNTKDDRSYDRKLG